MATTADINAGVAAASPKLQALIKSFAGWFAGTVEADLASKEGIKAEVDVVRAVIDAVDAARAARKGSSQ